jgi:allantoate deiminase
MRDVHQFLSKWMEQLGMRVSTDAAGNLHGLYAGEGADTPRLLIGSHLDTVPNAGAFDGVLGVVLGITLIECLNGRRKSFGIEIVGFSEEEGVRFGVPFIGSRALVGTVDTGLLGKRDANGIAVAQAIRDFGLDPGEMMEAVLGGPVLGYLEFHIEQGPVLESLNLPLGVVEAIAGQSRMNFTFRGQANHAGTTPMHLRRDALACAAEWIAEVEREARSTAGLVATVGRLEALPGTGNVIAGEVRASLDVRHASDDLRLRAVDRMIAAAGDIASKRGLALEFSNNLDQSAMPADHNLLTALETAVASAGYPVHRMVSGAGHDAMILAEQVPVAMLFLRSPGGISHHPDERVIDNDVEAALEVGLRFLDQLESLHG